MAEKTDALIGGASDRHAAGHQIVEGAGTGEALYRRTGLRHDVCGWREAVGRDLTQFQDGSDERLGLRFSDKRL
ncbi:hypothetical protein D3C81_2225420 [compost metagenome]